MSEVLMNEKDLESMSQFFKDSIIAVANTPCANPVQEYKNQAIEKLFDDYVSVVNNRMKDHLDRLNHLEEERKERLGLPSAKKVQRIINATQDDMLKKGEELLQVLKHKLKDAGVDPKDIRPKFSPNFHIDRGELVADLLKSQKTKAPARKKTAKKSKKKSDPIKRVGQAKKKAKKRSKKKP